MSDSAATIALITGANQGIGLEIARTLAADHGYTVLLSGRRRDAVEAAAASLQREGLTKVEPLVLDVTSDESIASAAAFVEEKYGRLDVLVNNGAITGLDFAGPEKDVRARLRHVFDTNVFGVAAATDAFVPLLRKAAGTKRIVFLTSSLGSLGRKADREDPLRPIDLVPYSTSKTALNMLALHYAARFDGDASWKFNVCCPGYCGTNLNHYAGTDSPKDGAIIACRLATDGPEGKSGTFVNRQGNIIW